MKVIELLNKRANGEEVPKKIRIENWGYKFEWVEHLDNYYDESADLDLMSALSMSKEELNYEIEIIEEDKPIEKLDYEINENNVDTCTEKIRCKINELIDEVNKLKKVEVMSNAKNHC